MTEPKFEGKTSAEWAMKVRHLFVDFPKGSLPAQTAEATALLQDLVRAAAEREEFKEIAHDYGEQMSALRALLKEADAVLVEARDWIWTDDSLLVRLDALRQKINQAE